MTNKKFKTIVIFLLSLFIFSTLTPLIVDMKVLADDLSTSSNYTVLADDNEIRSVKLLSETTGNDVIYTYHKDTGFLDIVEGGKVKSYDVATIGEQQLESHRLSTFRSSNSSLFSPWSYSSNGSRYTLRIAHVSYGAGTVSKTAIRSGRNSGYIDGFVSNIGEIRDAEWGVIKAAGWELAGAVIGAIVTGGVGAVTAVTGVWAVYQAASALPPIYDRALYNYNNVR